MEKQEDKIDILYSVSLKNETFHRKKKIGEILAQKREEERMKKKDCWQVCTLGWYIVILVVLLFILYYCIVRHVL